MDKIAKAEYMRAWYVANVDPEKNRAKSAAWRAAHPEKNRASRAAWRKANPEKYRAQSGAWAETNPEKNRVKSAAWVKAHLERHRARTIAWVQANPEKMRAYKDAWDKANPDIRSANNAKRRARKQSTDSAANKKAVAFLFQHAKRLGSIFGVPFDVDHIVPLSRGGKHHENNLQVIPSSINGRKGSRLLQYPVWASAQFSIS